MSNIANLGRLHNLLTNGLPDLVDADGRLNVQILADHLKISDKALYASFKRERVSSRQMNALVRLSKEMRPRKDFEPLTHSDLADFMAK